MDDRLAVETDNVDGCRIDALGGDERLNRLRVHARDKFVGFFQHTRPRHAVGQDCTLNQRLPQQRTLTVRIGPVAGRTEPLDALAVGLDQGHVDAVERGPAHQPNRPLNRQRPAPSFICRTCYTTRHKDTTSPRPAYERL